MKNIICILISMYFFTTICAYAENGEEFIDILLQSSVKNDENKVLEIRKQIESLPAVSHGERKMARELNDKGLAEFGSNNFENAVAIFLQAHKADSADSEIASNLGYSYLKLNKLDEAKLYLIRSLILSPGRSSAWAILAQAYAQQGDQTHAIAAFNLTLAFSQNRENTKAFLVKLAAENSGTATATAATKALEYQGVKPGSTPSLLIADKVSDEKPIVSNETLQTKNAIQQQVEVAKSVGVESTTITQQSSGRPGLPGLRLGYILDSLPQGARCVKSDELPELCAQAKLDSGDGAKARCLKKIDRDTISDNVQLCSYPYKSPGGMLANTKVEDVEVLVWDHRIIEIRATVAVPINRLLSAYEAKYGEPASLIFKIDSNYNSNYAALNPFQKKVYDEMKGSISAVLFSGGFEIESVTWWTGNKTDMVLAIPPVERVHDNLKNGMPGYDDYAQPAIERLIALGAAPRYSDNPWIIYYTDFHALMELSVSNSKSISENSKKRLNDL